MTYTRYAVRSDSGWLLKPRHYGPTWTKRPEFARLFTREIDAIQAAAQHSGVVQSVVVAFT